MASSVSKNTKSFSYSSQIQLATPKLQEQTAHLHEGVTARSTGMCVYTLMDLAKIHQQKFVHTHGLCEFGTSTQMAFLPISCCIGATSEHVLNITKPFRCHDLTNLLHSVRLKLVLHLYLQVKRNFNYPHQHCGKGKSNRKENTIEINPKEESLLGHKTASRHQLFHRDSWKKGYIGVPCVTAI